MPVIRKQVTQHYSGRSAGTPPFKTLKQGQKHADDQKRDRNALFGTGCGYTPLQNYLTKGFFRDFFEKHRPEQLPNTASARRYCSEKVSFKL